MATKREAKSEGATPEEELIPIPEDPPKKKDPRVGVSMKPTSQKKAPPPVANGGKPLVKFRVFEAASGIKPDQLAGFKSYVNVQKLGPMTMNDWRKSYDEFLNKPS